VSDYAHNTTIDFGGVGAKYVKLTANSNWEGLLNLYGLSEVRFLYIPVGAKNPSPASGATGVDLDVVRAPLAWLQDMVVVELLGAILLHHGLQLVLQVGAIIQTVRMLNGELSLILLLSPKLRREKLA
jgi:hypothetical protein